MGFSAAIAGAAVVGAAGSAYASSQAADAQKDASKRSSDTQRYMYEQSREDLTPYRESGYAALDELKGMLGLEGKSNFDISKTPGYQFNLDQGLQALDRSAAAGGTRLSGRAIKAAQRFGSGLASQEFGNRYNRLSSIAGLGQVATNTGAQLGANAANQISAAQLQAGNATAAGYVGASNNINQGLQNSLYAYSRYNSGGGVDLTGS